MPTLVYHLTHQWNNACVNIFWFCLLWIDVLPSEISLAHLSLSDKPEFNPSSAEGLGAWSCRAKKGCIIIGFLNRAAPAAYEVPRLGIKSDLQLQACTTATAMLDPSQICNLHHSLQQHWIHNPLSEAGDGICILMDTSQVFNLMSQNSRMYLF